MREVVGVGKGVGFALAGLAGCCWSFFELQITAPTDRVKFWFVRYRNVFFFRPVLVTTPVVWFGLSISVYFGLSGEPETAVQLRTDTGGTF